MKIVFAKHLTTDVHSFIFAMRKGGHGLRREGPPPVAQGGQRGGMVMRYSISTHPKNHELRVIDTPFLNRVVSVEVAERFEELVARARPRGRWQIKILLELARNGRVPATAARLVRGGAMAYLGHYQASLEALMERARAHLVLGPRGGRWEGYYYVPLCPDCGALLEEGFVDGGGGWHRAVYNYLPRQAAWWSRCWKCEPYGSYPNEETWEDDELAALRERRRAGSLAGQLARIAEEYNKELRRFE
jgi:hypothetical protein